jgi:hypothetical protein
MSRMSHPQRLPEEYLATLSEDDPLYQAQMAVDRMREERLRRQRLEHQDGPLVRAARAIERALSPRRF